MKPIKRGPRIDSPAVIRLNLDEEIIVLKMYEA